MFFKPHIFTFKILLKTFLLLIYLTNMYVCLSSVFVKINFDSIKKSMKHLKLQHSFSVFDKYICKQPLCVREFQPVHRFEKHLGIYVVT